MSCISAPASAITRQFSPELVGATGRVTAIEDDAEFAARATANLAQAPHVRVVRGDGTRIAFEPADVIYVNAGAAGSRVPDRAARPGIFGAPDLWGRDLSL